MTSQPVLSPAKVAEREMPVVLPWRGSLAWEHHCEALLPNSDVVRQPLEQMERGHAVAGEDAGRAFDFSVAPPARMAMPSRPRFSHGERVSAGIG